MLKDKKHTYTRAQVQVRVHKVQTMKCRNTKDTFGSFKRQETKMKNIKMVKMMRNEER